MRFSGRKGVDRKRSRPSLPAATSLRCRSEIPSPTVNAFRPWRFDPEGLSWGSYSLKPRLCMKKKGRYDREEWGYVLTRDSATSSSALETGARSHTREEVTKAIATACPSGVPSLRKLQAEGCSLQVCLTKLPRNPCHYFKPRPSSLEVALLCLMTY